MNAQTISVTPAYKSTPVSIRMQPRLHYLLQLAAREEDRSLTNYIEQAIKQSLTISGSPHLLNEGLWSEDLAFRFFLLATAKPLLLTDGELALWTRICADGSHLDSNGHLDRVKLSVLWNQLTSENKE